MINTVIFDMDGVLIDSEPIHQHIQQLLFKRFNISLSIQEYQLFIGRSSKNMWEELKARFDLTPPVEQFLSMDKHLYHQRLKKEPGLEAIPGIPGLLKGLSSEGFKLAVASSSSLESINLVLQLLKLEEFFGHRISGADLKRSKPDPLIFLKAAELVDSQVHECVVVEDSTHGVTAAKQAGMYCLGFKNPHSGNQDLSAADLVIEDFNSINTSTFVNFDNHSNP